LKEIEPLVLHRDIGDANIQYLLYEGDGPDVVMLHATGFLPWMWHPIARKLAGNCRVIAPYFCDHRHEEPEDGGIGWMLLAEDLCRLCESLKLKKPLLVGHSMGATVITLANAAHGDLARKMVLIEPIFLPEKFYGIELKVEDHPLAGKSIKRRNQWEDTVGAREYLKSKKLFADWDDEMLDIYVKYGMKDSEAGGLELTCHPRREAALFMGGMKYDPWPLMKKNSCPALLLEGEKSENRAYIDLKKAAGIFPNGQYKLLEGAGHLIPMEKPVEVTEIIEEFFEFSR